jgi:biopolymer transport protein ExbD
VAGGARGGGDDDAIITEINVTPLVDVTLVLLIILMVTATAIVSKTVNVELPNAQTAERDNQPSTLSVSIDRAGIIYLDMEPVTLEQLGTQAAAIRAQHADARAIIAADGRVREGQVLQVIDTLRHSNVLRFAINVAPEEPATRPRSRSGRR